MGNDAYPDRNASEVPVNNKQNMLRALYNWRGANWSNVETRAAKAIRTGKYTLLLPALKLVRGLAI